jgi:hypothetical protein
VKNSTATTKNKNWKCEYAALLVTVILGERPEYSEAAVTDEVMRAIDAGESCYKTLKRFYAQDVIKRGIAQT